ncbi:ATP synthase F1 subunit delta [Formicincola oecophyllae]|uniref:ATP synthase subunit delta n=1 Tax=Formicincola oecophyllae TaxID=2558361 RepID=A0A4Y6UCP8_9PROT|nr:ATP synthase F1 subunit delta [Formicincola oecophyllae]
MTLAQEQQIRAPGELAQRYARAFCDYLPAKGDNSETMQQVRALRDAIQGDPAFQAWLNDPRLNDDSARRIAEELANALHLDDALLRLIGVVGENGRLPELGEILEAVLLLDAKRRGIVPVEVATATPLTDHQRQQIQNTLTDAGYQHIVMTERQDSSLIGGMTVRVGSVLFDSSIAGRLTRLQNAMKGAA